jgi:PEP-CTERM/exosortase A-associated glycosyltransferase
MQNINQMINVYHILDHFIPEYSGYTFRTRSILQNQIAHGIEPRGIISPLYTHGLKEFEVIDGIDFNRSIFNGKAIKHNIPFLKQYQTIEFFKKDIYRVLKDKPRGVVHAHSPVLNALSAYEVARKLAMPFVYEVRAFWEDAAVDMGKTNETSLRYKVTKAIETNMLKKADAVITICQGLKKDMIKRGVDEKKIWVVLNGVSLDIFYPREKNFELVRRYNVADKKVLGFIGSFYNYEGLDLLIKAMPKIIATEKEAVLMLVGAGQQEPYLKKLVNELKLDKHVIFTGKVPHDQVPEYYSIIDVLVYPRISIRLTELVTPLKPLEAMAMGKPVVGSDIGGFREIIGDGDNGLLFKAGDVFSLAAKCCALLANMAKREELSHKGYGYVVKQRNWMNIIAQHCIIYKELLDNVN